MTVYDWTLAGKSSRSFEYVRYFGIVRTMPTYLIQPPDYFDLEELHYGYFCLQTILSLRSTKQGSTEPGL